MPHGRDPGLSGIGVDNGLGSAVGMTGDGSGLIAVGLAGGAGMAKHGGTHAI